MNQANPDTLVPIYNASADTELTIEFEGGAGVNRLLPIFAPQEKAW